MAEVIKTQALATAAGATTGSSATKAAVALSTMTPQVLSWAASNGYAIPDSASISAINTAIVNVLNLLGAPATTTTTTATTSATSTEAASVVVDGGKAI